MADAIVEQIRQDLVDAVATVTTGNGYTGTLTVEAVARHGNSTTSMTAVVEQGDEDKLDDDESACLRDTYHQKFMVFINVGNPNNVQDYDKLCNAAAADVRKAVMIDVTRGGLADWTRILPTQLFSNDAGEVAGIVAPFLVRYWTAQDDPYTQ